MGRICRKGVLSVEWKKWSTLKSTTNNFGDRQKTGNVPYSSCEQHWQTLPAKPGSFAFRSRISAPAFSALPTTIHSWRSQIVDRHDFSRYAINCRRLLVSIKPSISTAVRLYGWSTFSNRIDVPLDTLNSEPVLPAGCTKHLAVSDKIGAAAAAGADIVGMWFSGWLAGWRERRRDVSERCGALYRSWHSLSTQD